MEWILLKIADTVFGKLVGNYLEENFPRLFKNKNKELLRMRESRIRELEGKRSAEKVEHEEERIRIINALKRKSVSTDKLIDKYTKPLNAILISYSAQEEGSFIKVELEKYNAKYLGGTTSLIPPSKVPKYIKTNKDLSRWFKRNILKKRHCKIRFIVLFDLKKDAFWGTFLTYIQKAPLHRSIGDVLTIDDLFTEEEINKIALAEVIRDGDIAWLASTVLDGKELDIILKNQIVIEKQLGNPTLKQLSSEKMKSQLAKLFKPFIKKPSLIAKAIVDEAKFWDSQLN